MFRALMVRRMDPDAAGEVAAIFADHDRSPLPTMLGLTGRTLFKYGDDLYFHLIEAEQDVLPRLAAHRDHELFRTIDTQLARILRPYSPDAPSLLESRAQAFYQWSAVAPVRSA
jgi:cyclase